MADNVLLNAGTGGATLAADDIAGIHHQRVKVQHGADGAATDVSSASPLPVVQTGELPAGTQNIGDVDIASALPAGDNNIGNVDLASPLPAGTNNIGDVDVLTVPAPLNVVGGGLEATAQRVTIASDSTGVVSVDDNGGTLSVDDGGGSLSIDAASLPLPTGAATEATLAAVETDTSAIAGVAKLEDAAHTTGDAGYMALAVRSDTPSAASGTDGDYEPLHVGAEGGLWVSPTPSATGGLSIHKNLDVDETEDEVKGSAGALYGWYLANRSAEPRYVKFYNATAASVTVGTTIPVMTLPLPANSTNFVAANALGAHGIAFGTAITIAATTGLLDNDTGAPGLNDVVANLFFL